MQPDLLGEIHWWGTDEPPISPADPEKRTFAFEALVMDLVNEILASGRTGGHQPDEVTPVAQRSRR